MLSPSHHLTSMKWHDRNAIDNIVRNRTAASSRLVSAPEVTRKCIFRFTSVDIRVSRQSRIYLTLLRQRKRKSPLSAVPLGSNYLPAKRAKKSHVAWTSYRFAREVPAVGSVPRRFRRQRAYRKQPKQQRPIHRIDQRSEKSAARSRRRRKKVIRLLHPADVSARGARATIGFHPCSSRPFLPIRALGLARTCSALSHIKQTGWKREEKPTRGAALAPARHTKRLLFSLRGPTSPGRL